MLTTNAMYSKRVMKMKKWTRHQLAEEMGVSPNTLAAWLKPVSSKSHRAMPDMYVVALRNKTGLA